MNKTNEPNENAASEPALDKIDSTVLVGVEQCGLHKRTPYGIRGVSHTQLSIARYYGGITYNGEEYTYCPKTDELIRNDVLRWKNNNRKQNERTTRDTI